MAALADKLHEGRLRKEAPLAEAFASPTDAFAAETDPSPPAASSGQGASSSSAAAVLPMHFTYPSGASPLPRYTIRRGVGVGGFGEVYFAVSDAGKEVALKRVQRNFDVELRGVSQCLNLKHPNLVSLHDVCHDAEGQAWVVMEYIAGPNLRDRLDQHAGGLGEPEARRWFRGLAAGVNYLHASGLVHRDLKPGNLFDDAGIVKIGDYGLSKFISSSRRGGHTESVGTFHYMAPEVGRGEYGREIDIYALGVILCELLTGRVPFDGESSHEIVMKHLTAQPDLQGVPAPYHQVIAAALQKDPARRPRSLTEMVAPLGIHFDAYGLAQEQQAGPPASTPPLITARLVRGADEPASPASSPPTTAPPVSLPVATAAPPDPAPPRAHGPHQDHGPRQEPLARAVRSSCHDFGCWWRSLESAPGTRFILAVVAVVMLVLNTHWLLPLLSLVAIVYVPYYVIRQMLGGIERQPTFAEAHRQSLARQQAPRPLSRYQWQQRKRTELAAKGSLVRLAELTGSWLRAGLTTAALVGLVALLALRNREVGPLALAPFALMAISILLATAGLLGLGKLWERDEGEGLSRRLVLLGGGAALGAVTFGLTQFLMLPMDQAMAAIGIHDNSFARNLYARDGAPLLPAMMAHGAILLAGLRWWKNTDPLRHRRVSLWSVAVVVVAEWAIQQVLPIPQPWGMFAAGGTALIVQLTAPWENPREPLREPSTVPAALA